MVGGTESQGPGELQRRSYEASMLRISDEDRHKVAEVLRQAAGEGRIDLDELDERLEATYAAKTYGELVPITADLPVAGQPHMPTPAPRPTGSMVPAPSHDTSFSILGGVQAPRRVAGARQAQRVLDDGLRHPRPA